MSELSSTKLVVFDFDGTLVQSNAIKRTALYEVVAHIEGAADILDELLQVSPRLDRYGIFSELAKRVDGINSEGACSTYTRLCHERILAGDEVPGAFELMKALYDAGRVCMVNSSTPQAPLRDLIEQSRFALLVRATYGTPGGKLHNLKQAMASAGAQPNQTVMIGDGEDDRMSGELAGCAFIGVASNNNNDNSSSNAFKRRPEKMVERLNQAIPWLF